MNQPWPLKQVEIHARNPRMLAKFYREELGFLDHPAPEGEYHLGGEKPLLVLKQASSGSPRWGLYHVAYLFTQKQDFLDFVLRLAARRIAQSPTDHTQTVATYFSDPEGNGLEFYLDTPERGSMFTDEPGFHARSADGRLVPATQALDLGAFLGEGQELVEPGPDYQVPGNLRVGHIHLHTLKLETGTEFYSKLPGFRLIKGFPEMGVSFLAWGDYHHHVAVNTWKRVKVQQGEADGPGLAGFTLALPGLSPADAQDLTDPSGIRVCLEPGD